MRIHVVCRSCGTEQSADLSTGAKVTCAFCEHEASTGEATQRKQIETQQAKSKLFLRIAGAAGFAAAAMVAALSSVVEDGSGLAPLLWIGTGICFLAFVVFLALGEREREVVYF